MNKGDYGRLVSIVIPCHNEERFISEAIESALSQTYSPIEVIVVDDGSEDASHQIVESFGSKVQLTRQAWSGAAASRNTGVKLARGNFVMFLDADDLLAPDTIGALVEVLRNRNDSIAFCNWGVLSPCCEGTWRVTAAPHHPPQANDPLADWLQGRFVPSCSLLWPIRAFLKTGGWDEDLVANQDGDLAFRAFLNGVRLLPADHGYALYRQGTYKPRISSALGKDAFSSRVAVLDRVRAALVERNACEPYKAALGAAYYYLGIHYFGADRKKAQECARVGRELAGRDSVPGVATMRVVDRAFGLAGVVAVRQARLAVGRLFRKLGFRETCDGRCTIRPRAAAFAGARIAS